MSGITPASLGLEGVPVLFWDLDRANPLNAPEDQVGHLHEDLAQLQLGNELLLDIGWYPSFDPRGQFRVLVVKAECWDPPLCEREARTWLDLSKALAEARKEARRLLQDTTGAKG